MSKAHRKRLVKLIFDECADNEVSIQLIPDLKDELKRRAKLYQIKEAVQ